MQVTETTKTIPHHVLIGIAEVDRYRLLEQEVRRPDGGIVFLRYDELAPDEQEKSFSQAVSVGTVLCVGPEVDDVRRGDLAILDYTVDKTSKFVVYNDGSEKVVRIDTRTVYKQEPLVVDANRRTPHPTIIHKAGDLESGTLLIAVVRDGIIRPMWPYILMEHRKPREELVVKGGVWAENDKDLFSDRRVIASHAKSFYKPGDTVICESDGVFDRKLMNQFFDVVFEHDIAAVLKT